MGLASAISAICPTWSMQKKQQGASKPITRKPMTICSMPPTKQLIFSNSTVKALKRPNNIQTANVKKINKYNLI